MITFLCLTGIYVASEKYFATKFIGCQRIREIYTLSSPKEEQRLKFQTTFLVFAFNPNFS